MPPQSNEQFQYVQLPDGSYGKFRSDATDDDIRSAISKDFPDAYGATKAPENNDVSLSNLAEKPNNIPLSSYPMATAHGLASIGQGVFQAANAIRHPIDTAGKIIESVKEHPEDILAPLATGGIIQPAMARGIMSAIHDPLKASDAAGNQAGQIITGLAAEPILSSIKTSAPVENLKDYAAEKMRYPATTRQAMRGQPGTVKPIPFLPKKIQEWAVPQLAPSGRLGSPVNPGPFSELPLRVPSAVLKEEAAAAKPEEPIAHQPVRPKPGIARTLRSGGSPTESASTLRGGPVWNRPTPRNEMLEEEMGVESPKGRLRPIIGTPEEWQAYENRLNVLKPEAKAAGLYSAARGKAETIPDYQERIGERISKRKRR